MALLLEPHCHGLSLLFVLVLGYHRYQQPRRKSPTDTHKNTCTCMHILACTHTLCLSLFFSFFVQRWERISDWVCEKPCYLARLCCLSPALLWFTTSLYLSFLWSPYRWGREGKLVDSTVWELVKKKKEQMLAVERMKRGKIKKGKKPTLKSKELVSVVPENVKFCLIVLLNSQNPSPNKEVWYCYFRTK